MAIVVKNTSYSGEVLEQLLTLATTGNQLVEKGLIMSIPGVEKRIAIPRLRTGKMLQKRKEDPIKSDSKGNFDYSEKYLDPVDFMAFTVFNPRAFESIWRPFQPKGDMLFRELPPKVQNELLAALSKQVQFELGDLYINGEHVENGTDEQLMNGILTQMKKDDDLVIISSVADTMIGKLKDIRASIPKGMKGQSNLRILMSESDFEKYDDELTAREGKNSSETKVNEKKFKGYSIETIAAWPDDLIIATPCSMGPDGNLFVAVNLQDDENVIQIDKLTNAGESYFFKMLMKADTNIAFGEECIILDSRTEPVFVKPVTPVSETQA